MWSVVREWVTALKLENARRLGTIIIRYIRVRTRTRTRTR